MITKIKNQNLKIKIKDVIPHLKFSGAGFHNFYF